MDMERNLYVSDSRPELAHKVSSALFKTFGFMTVALFISALSAFLIAIGVNNGTINENLYYPLILGSIVVEFILVFTLSLGARKLSPTAMFMGFIAFAAVNGITLSTIFFTYELGTIAAAFVSTALMFGVMSIYGATTKRDLTSMGAILGMLLIGLLIMSVFNIFMQSSGLEWMISIIAIFLFTGLTIYDVNKTKKLAENNVMEINKLAIFMALNLYLDFINLFIYVLRILGKDSRK